MPLSQSRARLLGRLRSRRTRQREQRVLVEGVRSVEEALDAGARAVFAVASPRLEGTEAGRRLGARLLGTEENGGGGAVEVLRVPDAVLDDLADTEHAQGILLVCDEPSATLEALQEESLHGDRGPLLVLDAIQDPGNLGTLVRSAVAFGFHGVVCLEGTVDPWSPKSVRSSVGTVFRIPVVSATVSRFLPWLSGLGVEVLVADAVGTPAAEVFAEASGGPGRRRALVLGNEGAGVRDAVREVADATVAVPMSGPAESLNVGIAGSILMYEMVRSRQ